MQLEEKLHENVYYYTDVMSDPEKVLEIIERLDGVEESYSAIPKWKNWNSSSRDGNIFGKKKDFNLSGVEGLPSEIKAEVDSVITEIRTAIKNVAEAFVKDRGLPGAPNISPFVGIQKYIEGCSMGAHYDRQAGDNSLEYSMILYWNDNYDGGEISFVIRDEDFRLPQNGHLRPPEDALDPRVKDLVTFTKKPKANSALIFPSTDPYKHQVHIMKKGDKYISPGFLFVDGYVVGGPGGPTEEAMRAYSEDLDK